MGSQKRERQRQGRQVKTVAQQAAARRQKTRRRGVRLAIGAVIVLAAALGYSLLTGDDDSSDEAADETAADETAADETAAADEVLNRQPPVPANASADLPADAVEVETFIEGDGEGAAAGDTVVVHYVGVLADGTQFDTSWDGEPFRVENLGQAPVIDGWNEGLVGAKVGERRRIEIGPDKAYGAQGSGNGDIPPDAPLAFEIDVVDIERAGG